MVANATTTQTDVLIFTAPPLGAKLFRPCGPSACACGACRTPATHPPFVMCAASVQALGNACTPGSDLSSHVSSCRKLSTLMKVKITPYRSPLAPAPHALKTSECYYCIFARRESAIYLRRPYSLDRPHIRSSPGFTLDKPLCGEEYNRASDPARTAAKSRKPVGTSSTAASSQTQMLFPFLPRASLKPSTAWRLVMAQSAHIHIGSDT